MLTSEVGPVWAWPFVQYVGRREDATVWAIAKNEAPICSLLIKMTGAKFERVLPKDKTFDCDAKYLATNLKTEYVAAAKLDGNRVATAFGTYTP